MGWKRVGRGMGIRRLASPGKDNFPKNINQPARGKFRTTQPHGPNIYHTPNAPTTTVDSCVEDTPSASNPKDFSTLATATGNEEASRTTRHLPLKTRA